MKMKYLLLSLALVLANVSAFSQDTNFWIFVCFGQSNMEGYNLTGAAGIPEQDKTNVDSRFQVFASMDFPALGRTKGNWYTAIPPLCRPSTGLCPLDYFGRTLASNLPPNIKIGIVTVAVAGCKIELFDKTNYAAYADAPDRPGWMKNIIKAYEGNPYAYLVQAAKQAQKDGVIKGFILHQGESNTGDKQWPNKVKGVYDNLINDLGLQGQNEPLLAGEVVNSDVGGVCGSMNPIIDTLPQTIPNCYVISSTNCACRPQDHLHFMPAGYRELGTRYGLKMLSVLGYPVK